MYFPLIRYFKSTILFIALTFCLLPCRSLSAAGPDKSGVKPQVINLPSGAGSIQGLGDKFQPHLNTGTASYGVPLVFPAGTGGLAPTLRLVYDGGNGNGAYGLGWRLEMPYIQRQTDKGLPQYTNSDLFIHGSGEELVPLADGSYRYRIESSFTRLQQTGDSWEAAERNGIRWLFGETENGRQTNSLGIFCWLPQRLIDTNGNEVRFFYTHDNGQIYLDEIRYNFARGIAFGSEPADGGVHIKFEYETRPDPLHDYRSRSLVLTNLRAKAIEITALGQRVRRYELGYQNRNGSSLLTEVRSLGRDLVRFEDDPTKGLPPLHFDYTRSDPALAKNVSMNNPPLLQVGDANSDLVDINGDALPDIIQTDPFNGHRFYVNRGRGQWAAESLIPNLSPNASLETSGVQIADANGDGWADLLVKTGDSVGAPFFYYPNKGGNAWELNDRIDFNFNPAFTYEDPNVQLVDLDNDRRIDVLRTTDSAYLIYFNSPKGWSAEPNRITAPLFFGTTLLFNDPRVKLADMNGDRLQDMVFIMSSQVVYFPAKGYGDFDSVVQMQNSPALSDQATNILLADVNGDGLTDLLQVDRFNVYLWLNQAATGFSSEIIIANTPEYIAGETNLRTADMNGDGATDLLYSTYPADAENIFRYIDFSGDTLPNLLTTIDNGLGRVIGLTYRTSTDYYVDEWNAGEQWTQRSPVAVTVVSRSTMTDKNSGQIYITDYSYRNAYYDGKEKTFRGFAIAQQSDVGDASAPTQVTQLIFDTGKENESRKGMILQQDLVGEGGSCGATTGVAARMASTNLTTALDSQAQTLTSSIIASSADELAKCYNRVVNQIETRILNNGKDGRNISFSIIRQTDTYEYETTATARRKQQSFLYDDFGNRTQAFDYGEISLDGSNLALGNDEQLTYQTYIISPTLWIIDRVSQTRQTDLNGNSVSEQRFYYDGAAFTGLSLGQLAQGNLTREESNLGPSAGNRWVQTQRFRYDAYGNQIGRMDPNGTVDVAGQPGTNGHWTEVTFDPTFHAFPTVETIHLEAGKFLAITAEYDLGFGVITRATDFSGQATTFVYDGLARLIASVKPGDSVVMPTQIFTYTLGGAVSSVTTESREQSGTNNVYRSVSYVDGLGRTLQTRSEGENGKVVVKDAVTFNQRSGIQAKYLAYYAANATLDYTSPESDKAKVSITYDPMLRPIEITNPDDTITRTLHLPLEQVLYDEEDTKSTSPHYNTPTSLRYDGRGRLVQVLERNGTEVYTTTYSYDVLDNLTTIIDVKNNLKRQSFDWLKRKLSIDDPNRGVKNFTYDDIGNVIETLDAKGQRITFTYDGASRVRSENFILANNDATPDITYHYDKDLAAEYPDAKHTVGRLSWVEDQSGREYLSYDVRGNVAAKIKRIIKPADGATLDFVNRMQYDAMDRLVSTTYPDGFQVTYQYNPQALLESIPGFVQNIDYIASGQRDLLYTADCATTDFDYDSRLRLSSLRTLAAASVILQNWRYHFDDTSNVIGIDDLRLDRTPNDDDTRTFILDDLYRLTSVHYSADAKDVIEYAYDPIGNLVRKTSTIANENLGEMLYGQSAGPHALTQVGNASWRYDTNGNLITKPGFNYVWDFRDRMVKANGSDGLLQAHTYDYADTRITKLTKSSQGQKLVLYPDQTVEVRDGKLVKYVFVSNDRFAEIRTPFNPSQLIRGFGHQVSLLSLDSPHFINSNYQIFLPIVNNSIAISNGEVFFYHADYLGSSSLVLDSQGKVIERNRYFAFGTERTVTSNPKVAYRFTGQELDNDIGLYNYGARFYDASVGRFVSVDPVSYGSVEKKLNNSQSLNVYTYALNNPVRYIDPDGLDNWDRVWGGLKALGGLAEASAGAALGIATSWTGVGAVAGGVVLVHGADVASAGLRQVISGQPESSLTSQGLQAAGMSRQTAELTDNVISIVGTAGASAGINLTRQSSVMPAANINRTTAGRNRLAADSSAQGPHSTFKRNPQSGKITNYETYKPQTNPRNPNPWQSEKRVDIEGGSHFNKTTGQEVPTPHVHESGAPGGVRPATPSEIPGGGN